MSTAPDLFLTSITKANRGPEIRPPAVAGAFYPGTTEEVNVELDRMLDGTPANRYRCAAAMIPHAGWVYSGRLAAQTLAQIDMPRRAIIFAPKHRNEGALWAMAPNRVWAFPGGNVESDSELAESLVKAVDFFEFDAEAHTREHSIEVQLPILARVAPKTKVACALIGMSTWAMIQQAAAQFSTFLENMPDPPILIVSSDMNHYGSDEVTRKVDRLALDAIREAVELGKPEHAFSVILENNISMCGVIPMVFVLETLRRLGRGKTLRQVGYTTSAETSGDKSRVVGYAGLLLQ